MEQSLGRSASDQLLCWNRAGGQVVRGLTLAAMRTERDAAVADLDAANRAITATAVERVVADRRQGIAGTAHEAIVAALASDDGTVSPVLLRALAAADAIGGAR